MGVVIGDEPVGDVRREQLRMVLGRERRERGPGLRQRPLVGLHRLDGALGEAVRELVGDTIERDGVGDVHPVGPEDQRRDL